MPACLITEINQNSRLSLPRGTKHELLGKLCWDEGFQVLLQGTGAAQRHGHGAKVEMAGEVSYFLSHVAAGAERLADTPQRPPTLYSRAFCGCRDSPEQVARASECEAPLVPGCLLLMTSKPPVSWQQECSP